MLLIGDFNASVGEEKASEINQVLIVRKSKDLVKTRNGFELLELCDSFGFKILNGTEKYKFVGGQVSSVVYFGIVRGDWNNHVVDFEVLNEPYSDHMPLLC